jgi:hypothetical protein
MATTTTALETTVNSTHTWGSAPYCSCGQDTVTCQITGHLVCGELTQWVDRLGNVCLEHLSTRNPDTIMAVLTDPRSRVAQRLAAGPPAALPPHSSTAQHCPACKELAEDLAHDDAYERQYTAGYEGRTRATAEIARRVRRLHPKEA